MREGLCQLLSLPRHSKHALQQQKRQFQIVSTVLQVCCIMATQPHSHHAVRGCLWEAGTAGCDRTCMVNTQRASPGTQLPAAHSQGMNPSPANNNSTPGGRQHRQQNSQVYSCIPAASRCSNLVLDAHCLSCYYAMTGMDWCCCCCFGLVFLHCQKQDTTQLLTSKMSWSSHEKWKGMVASAEAKPGSRKCSA